MGSQQAVEDAGSCMVGGVIRRVWRHVEGAGSCIAGGVIRRSRGQALGVTGSGRGVSDLAAPAAVAHPICFP